MEDIKNYKEDLIQACMGLEKSRQEDAMAYYDRSSIESVAILLVSDARREAESVKRYADNRGYGYGEVGYNLNERVDDLAEEFPELKEYFSRLIHAYFSFFTEAEDL